MQADFIIGANAEFPCEPPPGAPDLPPGRPPDASAARDDELTPDEIAELLAGADDETIADKLKRLRPHENYTWDDKGLAEIFATVYVNAARYNVTAKSWYAYNGKRWVMDTGDMCALRLAKQFADALIAYAATIPQDKPRKDYLELALKYGQLRRRETLVKDARDVHFISSSDLDANTDLFNCQNGTLNLRTGVFSPHRPQDMLSKISRVDYDPEAPAAAFEAFIDEIMQGDAEKADYLQRVLGLSLTTDTSVEACWILYGHTTRNGKSTLVETIAHMMGDYAATMPPENLAQREIKDASAPSGNIARLEGCRFLNASEPSKRMRLDAARLKTLIGRDTIVARNLYERERQFIPAFKLFINTNYLPIITDLTLFSSGRINIITFDRHFEPHEQDKGLKTRLQQPENMSGILNWCLEGLRKFRQLGAAPPECVAAATKEYRTASDKIGMFFDECMEETGEKCSAGHVYDYFKKWCAVCGFGVESKLKFFDELKNRDMFAKTATINSKTVRNVVIGYELTEEAVEEYGWSEASNSVPF